MGKNPQRKRRNKTADVLIVVILLILMVDALMIWMIRDGKTIPEGPTEQMQQSEVEQTREESPAQLTTQQTVPEETTEHSLDAMEFPIALEDGSLTVLSMFQYSGLNPDCGDQDGTDIAGIMIENTSLSHLTHAQLEIATDDGRVLRFTASDIPAGRSAMIFSQENGAIKPRTACVGISCEAQFEESTPLMTDLVEIQVSETGITVSNISGTDLLDLTVYCHGVLETDYYGGVTYQYSVPELPAGEKYDIDTSDVFLGMLEVVRVGALSE